MLIRNTVLMLALLGLAGACRRTTKSEEDSCRESEDCKKYGACHYVEGQKQQLTHCVALRAEDCAHSQRCADEGVCGLVETGFACEITPLGCKRSKACTAEGRCRVERRSHKEHPLSAVICGVGPADDAETAPESVPMTDQDCAASRACKDYGLCKLFPGGTFCTKP